MKQTNGWDLDFGRFEISKISVEIGDLMGNQDSQSDLICSHFYSMFIEAFLFDKLHNILIFFV
jgi:hypothetical protein